MTDMSIHSKIRFIHSAVILSDRLIAMYTLTSLIPELDVLDSHGDQLSLIVWVPADEEDLVLVASGRGEFLSFFPVPDNNGVVIIQPNRC